MSTQTLLLPLFSLNGGLISVTVIQRLFVDDQIGQITTLKSHFGFAVSSTLHHVAYWVVLEKFYEYMSKVLCLSQSTGHPYPQGMS